MSQLKDRLERDLREIAAGAHPSPSAWESIVERLDDGGESEVARVHASDPDRPKRPPWIAVAAAALVVIIGSTAVFVSRGGDEPSISGVVPTIPPTASPFVGIWVSIDTDGSSQTIEIVLSGADDYEFALRDDFATACSGAPATMTGAGRLETDERLVIAQPVLTCDDGTIPRVGPPPQAELANFTLELNGATDEFVDSFGVVWRRPGSNDEPTAASGVTVPALAPGTSGGMWPQSSLDEVRAAQELADAGDPAYTWQLDTKMAAEVEPWGAQIFTRFIEEELGWEEFVAGSSFSGLAFEEGLYDGVLFIRCAPGQTNPLNSLFADAPSGIRGCAPTVDDLTYETVRFTATQPDRRGPSGIWVVERWEMLQSQSDPGSLFGLLYPDFDRRQIEQIAPPSDAEVTAFLQTFLRARMDGEGAEQYVLREPDGSPFEDTPVPLLYATTGGAPYERSEIERLQGPVWPTGWTEYKVRLFAEGDTVVEQHFHVVRHDGQLGLVYGHASTDLPTTENGQPVAVPFSFLHGEVTFTAAPPLAARVDGPSFIGLDADPRFGRVMIAADPRPDREGCENAAAPADAEALARSIMADPDFETAQTVPVSIAGIDALQMDVVFSEQDLCYVLWSPEFIPAGGPGWRMRLYLIDHPGASAEVLTIAIIAPETDFERLLEEATPIVESLAFHPG